MGVIGRSKYSEKEHYNYWAKRLRLDGNMSREEQIEEIKNQNCSYKKYYNFNGFKSGHTLYNANRLSVENKDEVFIAEGPFDVMKMVLKHGYKNTVGMLGHSLSRGQLYQLYELYKDKTDTIKVYLLVDNDEVGLKNFEKNVKSLQELGFKNIYKMIIEGVKDAGKPQRNRWIRHIKVPNCSRLGMRKKE